MARERTPESDGDDTYDRLEHQGSYIFAPGGGAEPVRPSKRRRKAPDGGEEAPQKCLFPPLFAGKESELAIQTRWEIYHRLWAQQEARIRDVLDSFNQKTLDDVSTFVSAARSDDLDGKIPTALVLTGPNIASHAPLFAQFAERIRDKDSTGPVVVLTSKDAVNLKGALRKIIKDATMADEGVEEEETEDIDTIMGRKGRKLLNYDLQILQNWCALHPDMKVTVAIQDTEAFDAAILGDLVSLFSSYLDRIPFVLLLGIATSLEIFHEKLPKATIRMMRGDKFDVERAEECLAQVFNDAVLGSETTLRLGTTMCDLLMDRQKNHTQSIQTFVAALKYAYMSHFYANPLSIVLGFLGDQEGLGKVLADEHVEAIRNLPSFRKSIETKLEDRETTEIRALLEDDFHLRSAVTTAASDCHSYALQLGEAIEVLELARSGLSSASNVRIPRYELLPRVLSGDLHVESPLVRELLLSVKKMNSKSFLTLISMLSNTAIANDLFPFKARIDALVSSTSNGGGNLTSEFDVSLTSSLRSTAVSKKIQISAHKSTLSKHDTLYSQLIQEVYDVFAQYFSTKLEPISNIFLHELFFYDLPSPHRDVFAPRARGAVERALARPAQYLGCECCHRTDEELQDDEGAVMRSHPATSIAYQLYLEGGALINTYDLWSAFKSVVTSEDAEEDDDDVEDRVDEGAAQALFYRSIAEMNFLGFVKQTRKRVDHLQKLAWRGL